MKTVPVKVEMTPETKCGFCTNSKCCTYTTQEIPTPRSKYDFDHMLWQLSHANIQAYKDEDGWYLLINNPCTHLQKDGRCGIYDTRPQVCRAYSNDYCEYDEPAEKNFELFFDGYPALLRYCKKRFKNWGREKAAKKVATGKKAAAGIKAATGKKTAVRKKTAR